MLKRLSILFFLFISASLFMISCTEEAAENKKEILKPVKDSVAIKDLDRLFFVGNNGAYTGIYKYDFETDSYEMFWSARNESVVKLLYSDDLQYIFFLTARSFGIKNGISFINKIKLYRLLPDLSMVEYVTDIGDAIQIFAYWEGINFRIQFTSIDLRVATYVNRTNQIYSPFGKLIEQTVDVFDFIKNGYPAFDAQSGSLLSPSGKFGFLQKEDALYFKIIKNQYEFFVDTLSESFNKITWTPDENYAFITTSPGNTGEDNAGSVLLVYNILSHKPEHKWNSGGKINLLLTNTYLIFDLFNGEESSLNIYNYKKFEDVRKIRLRNGCGLTAVP